MVRATGAVGKGISFGSHCWGAPWGLLVASLADKADPKRRVWVDARAAGGIRGAGEAPQAPHTRQDDDVCVCV